MMWLSRGCAFPAQYWTYGTGYPSCLKRSDARKESRAGKTMRQVDKCGWGRILRKRRIIMKKITVRDNRHTGLITTNATNTIGAVFDLQCLGHGFYGERAYRHLLKCLDVEKLGKGSFYSGDIITMTGPITDYVIAFSTEDLNAAKYFTAVLSLAFSAYNDGLTSEGRDNIICDGKSVDDFVALGKMLRQDVIYILNEEVEQLPLLWNGDIENDVLIVRSEHPLSQAI